ncbi:phage minor head protein [Novosphingobium sp. NDB2Meth1]|uniref:phage head morphogenesis protein n=1 Tax=Novosphingobium sp. NDB2Meth1 TaxID=1892847 RepID=UPI000931C8EA|nr:phage minor head protein [Novosphingobium sp. NDB2Meth1]
MSGAAEPLPRLDPAEAIAFFRAKGWEIAFDWRDVWAEENIRAFTVAKAMSRDLLEDIRGAVDTALAEGQTLQQFAKDLAPKLFAKGWWGKKLMTDPATGEQKVVQLGSPARLRTIYETNLRTSYMAGRWQRIEKGKALFPFIRYVSVLDGRERPQHHAWHGTILPVDDPWWDTHFPPCGWGCRCDGQPINRRIMERRNWKSEAPPKFVERSYVNKRTGEVIRVEAGIDPGWGYNVGKAPLDGLAPAPRLGGDMGELNAAAFSDREFARVKPFFDAFGLGDKAAATKGKIWQDAAGWPAAISLGLLRGPTGRMIKLKAGELRALEAAAGVLLQPDSIAWVWVKGEDGRLLLVRRYAAAGGAVDIGGSFWRWRAGSTRGLASGKAVWTADQGEINAKRSRYVRDRKGRFASTGGAGQWSRPDRAQALAAMKDAKRAGDVKPFKRTRVGAVSSAAAGKGKAGGIDIAGRSIVLDHTFAAHIIGAHGPDVAAISGELPITGRLLMDSHRLMSRADTIERSGIGHRMMPRLKAVVPHQGVKLAIIADVSADKVIIVSVHEDRPGGKKLNRDAQAKLRKMLAREARARRKGKG